MDDHSGKGFAHPESLVSTAWLAEHLSDPTIRIVESNEDQLLYSSGHIPGAVEIDWVRDLNDPVRRDYLDRGGFQELMSRSGISRDTTVVLYGDKSNWWATYAYWIFSLFGHRSLKILDGGRLKWEKEGRPMTKERPAVQRTEYPAPERNDSLHRAFRDEVLAHIGNKGAFIDVRSPDEFSGKRLHMEGYPNEGAVRGGHVPGAKNVPWATAVRPEDGTFKSAAELKAIYEENLGLSGASDVVVYCRIGERSSHTWFVLTQLLGFKSVRNYDGSWTEWGNLVNVPIEK